MLVQIGATNRLGQFCTLQEVQRAIQSLGLDSSQVELVDDGVFLTPLPEKWNEMLEMHGFIEEAVGDVLIEAEMP